MDIRGETGNADIVDVIQPHVEVLGDVVVVPARDESQLVLTVIDGDSVGVERVVGLADEIQLGADLQELKGLAAFPVAESGDVKVRQMNFLDGFVFSASHKAFVFEIKLSVFSFREQSKSGVAPKCGTTEKIIDKKQHPSRSQGDDCLFLGARRGRTFHYVRFLASVSRKWQDVSRLDRTSHTFHESWLYAPFQRTRYGGLEPLLPTHVRLCSKYTGIYRELSYIGRTTVQLTS